MRTARCLRRARLVALSLSALAMCAPSTSARGEPARARSEADRALEAMVAAERAFAAASERDGMRAAFLAFAEETAVVFRPGPVAVREWFAASPDPPGRLLWEPARAEISAAGDLGYTLGPWRFESEGETAAAGHFLTVWRRQADGAWRWLADIGTVHPPAEGEGAELELRRPGAAPAGRPEASGGTASLEAAEAAFSADSAERGEAAAYRDRAAEDLRLLRQGVAPVAGREAAVLLLAAGDRRAEWIPERFAVSESGDLGALYGRVDWVAVDGEASSGSYLRVWRLGAGGVWEVAAEVSIPGLAAAE